jgi:hypothetical protein
MTNNNIALIGKDFITLDPDYSDIGGIIVEYGRITFMGTKGKIKKTAQEKNIPILDCTGKTVIPGFHDCHVHVLGTGLDATGIDLYQCKSISDVLDILSDALKSKGKDWLHGIRLDESRLKEQRPPTISELDNLSTDRGIFLADRGLHYTQVNSLVYREAGIKDSLHGVKKDISGKANGRLQGQANKKVRNYFHNQLSRDKRIQAINAAVTQAIRKGVTTIHGMEGGTLFSDMDIPVFKEIMPELPLDIVIYWDTMDLDLINAEGFDKMGTDMFIDGSIGSRTAAFDQPYADAPETCGILYNKTQDITNLIVSAHKMNIQCGFHSIGQAGIRQSLDALEKALDIYPVTDHRYRIEHFGFPDQVDIKRAAELGVIISTQPAFTYLRGGPGSVYNHRLGDKRERKGYNLRAYLDAGNILAGGSDSGVTPIDPLLGIHSAVNPPYPETAANPLEALKMFTCNGAWAAFEEKIKGTISPGKLGDFTITDDNPLSCPCEQIRDIKIAYTIKDGKIIYESGE